MKKLLLIFPIILMGCAELSKVSELLAPPETIYNDKCAEIQEYRVFQVMSDGNALAAACDTNYNYRIKSCLGLTVFVPAQRAQDLYDDKIITPADGKCIVYDGVYKYESKGAGNKTVPKLNMIDSIITNPAYIEWLDNQIEN